LIQIEYADYERHQEIVKSVAVRVERGIEIVGDELAPIEAALRHAHQLRKPPFRMVDG
jgi:hypothetical protein